LRVEIAMIMRGIVRPASVAIGAALLLLPAVSSWAHHRHHVSVWLHGGPWWPAPVYAHGHHYWTGYPSDWSAIDTDIHPEEAEVWLDGEFIGIADRFDGWPSYLEVPPGDHRLEFRLEGYRTLRIDLQARPGAFYRLNRSLRFRADQAESEPAEEPPPKPTALPAGCRLRLSVTPDDAVIYIDDRLVGTARALSAEAIPLTAGKHRVEVVRPDHHSWKRVLSLESDEERKIRIALRPLQHPDRRDD
jgi:hypothetical protein